MTSLNLQELQHLEKLSCIKIDENKQSIFLDKLDNVIDKLNELNKIDTNWIHEISFSEGNPLRIIWWNKDFSNKKWIIDNAKHDVINNSIMIKSALSND